ncbi:MAG: hypothetical protein ACLQSR_06620 [Limisphaerales bacterium]
MKTAPRIILVAVLLAAGVWGWTLLNPSPEHVIRVKLRDLAKDVSFQPGENLLVSAMSAQSLGQFFSTNVEMNLNIPGIDNNVLAGRDQIVQTALAARARLTQLKLDFPDVNVTVAPDKNSAVADLTVRAKINGDREGTAEEMKFTFQNIDGQWLITRIESVQVLG